MLSVGDSGALLEGAKWPKAQERVFWYSLEAKVAVALATHRRLYGAPPPAPVDGPRVRRGEDVTS